MAAETRNLSNEDPIDTYFQDKLISARQLAKNKRPKVKNSARTSEIVVATNTTTVSASEIWFSTKLDTISTRVKKISGHMKIVDSLNRVKILELYILSAKKIKEKKVVGRIHLESSVKYWREVIKPAALGIAWLENGIPLFLRGIKSLDEEDESDKLYVQGGAFTDKGRNYKGQSKELDSEYGKREGREGTRGVAPDREFSNNSGKKININEKIEIGQECVVNKQDVRGCEIVEKKSGLCRVYIEFKAARNWLKPFSAAEIAQSERVVAHGKKILQGACRSLVDSKQRESSRLFDKKWNAGDWQLDNQVFEKLEAK
ncbi:17873_t:CDS:10 [Gigaspora margarita]|uniref:17873_t:CDS:1 n=1 Tax=Gigaspora margarita TaxID=4874 RepID=A0ABN7V287_GIGMA|nr:17873_t:CDS:10 [Gigaspora margarita]